MKTLVDFQHQEYAIKFIVGLNDSYSHVRGRILVIDPLPPIKIFFSLIL